MLLFNCTPSDTSGANVVPVLQALRARGGIDGDEDLLGSAEDFLQLLGGVVPCEWINDPRYWEQDDLWSSDSDSDDDGLPPNTSTEIPNAVGALAGGGPAAGGPAVGDAAAGGPAAGGPAAGGPAAGVPAAGGPAVGDPAAGGPAAGNPAAGDPVAGGPAVEDPAARGPAAGGPAAEVPAAGGPADGAGDAPAGAHGGPGIHRKRRGPDFYRERGNDPLHTGTAATVFQACYALLKLKIEYSIHDTAFDLILGVISDILPEGHIFPG